MIVSAKHRHGRFRQMGAMSAAVGSNTPAPSCLDGSHTHPRLAQAQETSFVLHVLHVAALSPRRRRKPWRISCRKLEEQTQSNIPQILTSNIKKCRFLMWSYRIVSAPEVECKAIMIMNQKKPPAPITSSRWTVEIGALRLVASLTTITVLHHECKKGKSDERECEANGVFRHQKKTPSETSEKRHVEGQFSNKPKSAFTPAGKKGWHESCLANPHVPSSRDVPAAFHPLLPMKTLSGGNIPAWQNFVSEVSDRTRRTKTSNCLAFGFSVFLDAFARKNWRREEIQFRI